MKELCARETGRATNGRPYDAIVCEISEELAGGMYAAPTTPTNVGAAISRPLQPRKPEVVV